MGWIANINIGKRLGAGFSLVLALTVLIALAAIWRLDAISNATSTMMAAPLVKERLLADWHTQTFAAVRRTAAIAKSSDPSLVEFFKADGIKTASHTSEVIKKVEPLIEGDKERALFNRIGELRKAYTAGKEKAIKLRASGDAEGADRVLNQEYIPAAAATAHRQRRGGHRRQQPEQRAHDRAAGRGRGRDRRALLVGADLRHRASDPPGGRRGRAGCRRRPDPAHRIGCQG